MKENNKTNTLLLTVIGVATLLVSVIGATFAYFTGNAQSTSGSVIEVQAGKFLINYTSNDATEQNLSPTPKKVESTCGQNTPLGTAYTDCGMEDYEPVLTKTFSVTGTNTSEDKKMPYTIHLTITHNSFELDSSLKYALAHDETKDGMVKEDTEWHAINAGQTGTIQLGVDDSNTESIDERIGYFAAGSDESTHGYVLNIYFPDNNTVQDADKTKGFAAYVQVKSDEIA